MISKSTIGLERDDHETGWLVTARLLWIAAALSVIYDVRQVARLANDPSLNQPALLYVIF
jgi:hypothetical protein